MYLLCNALSGSACASKAALDPHTGLSKTLQCLSIWKRQNTQSFLKYQQVLRGKTAALSRAAFAVQKTDVVHFCAHSAGFLEFCLEIWKLPYLWQVRQASSSGLLCSKVLSSEGMSCISSATTLLNCNSYSECLLTAESMNPEACDLVREGPRKCLLNLA